MDCNDKMIMADVLLQSHVTDTSTIDEHLAIITCLLGLLAEVNGGSKIGRNKNKDRQMMEGHLMLVVDYFADDPSHGSKAFRRRFRMKKEVYLRIVQSVREFDDYFMLKKDCIGMVGFSSIQKYKAMLRCLAYRAPADTQDD